MDREDLSDWRHSLSRHRTVRGTVSTDGPFLVKSIAAVAVTVCSGQRDNYASI